MGRFIDITGKKFGRWTVIERAENRIIGGKPTVFWKCRCDCGAIREVNGRALRDGTSVSCGCYQKEQAAKTAISRKKKNDYRIIEDTVVVNARGGTMLCDAED